MCPEDDLLFQLLPTSKLSSEVGNTCEEEFRLSEDLKFDGVSWGYVAGTRWTLVVLSLNLLARIYQVATSSRADMRCLGNQKDSVREGARGVSSRRTAS